MFAILFLHFLFNFDRESISNNRFNKLTSVFYASVPLLMINSVIKFSKWLRNHESQASGSAVNSDNVMTQLTITKRTEAQKKLKLICFYNNKTTKWSNAGGKDAVNLL